MLHTGLVVFIDIICWQKFIRGYPFFYFCCEVMTKQNNGEYAPMCLVNNKYTKHDIHKTPKGQMGYR